MSITNWLVCIKKAWESHAIDDVLALFDPTVEYWETPYKKLHSLDEVRTEWQSILTQSNISLQTKLLFSKENYHAAIWELSYLNKENLLQEWAGTYLIRLNESGLCIYFHHTGEKAA